jgi:hypothetical protein
VDTEATPKSSVSYLFGDPKARRRDTKSIGMRSELAVMTALIRNVSIPFGENSRYDIVADDGKRLYRIQVKTGQDRGSYIRFPCSSSHEHRGRPCRSYFGEVEYIAVYCHTRDKVYLVPESEIVATVGHLRIDPPTNGQKKKIRWARQYELL